VAKFVPGLNAVASPLAGRSGSSLGRFLMFDSLGTLFWLTSVTSVGYIFSDQLETVADYALRMGSGLGVLVAALLAAWMAWKFVQRQRFLHRVAVGRITAEELREKLDASEEVLIVDVRHLLPDDPNLIPGALLISVEELAGRHSEIPRDRDLILVCD
jgi:hypothetical protein